MENTNKNIDYIKALSIIDEEAYFEICKVLEENKVPYYVQDEGEILKIVSGFDFFQCDIYISNEHTSAAIDLIYYLINDGDYNEYIEIFV